MGDSYRAQVQRGAVLLDTKVDDHWWDKIELSVLALDDAEHCILGQLFSEGGYDEGLGVPGLDYETAARNGFDAGGQFYDWDLLQTRWEEEITKRRDDPATYHKPTQHPGGA